MACSEVWRWRAHVRSQMRSGLSQEEYGLCPQAWLTDVLTRLPTTRNRDIDSLLPIEGWAVVSG